MNSHLTMRVAESSQMVPNYVCAYIHIYILFMYCVLKGDFQSLLAPFIKLKYQFWLSECQHN